MADMQTQDDLFGLLAEFDDPETLVEKAEQAYAAGYRHMEGYSPIPVHGLSEALGKTPWLLPWLVLGGATAGGGGMFVIQYLANVVFYPINIGGRPLNSWPAFMVPTFEMAILSAAITAVVGMIILNGLPKPYHPVFNAPNFQLASQDRFFLCIEATDPGFDLETTRAFLQSLEPLSVVEVPKGVPDTQMAADF